MGISKEKRKIQIAITKKKKDIDASTATFVKHTRQMLDLERDEGVMNTCKTRILDGLARQVKDEDYALQQAKDAIADNHGE